MSYVALERLLLLALFTFKLIFCAFIVFGSSIQLQALIDLSDALVFVVAIPNLLGLYILAPVIKREIIRYRNLLDSDVR